MVVAGKLNDQLTARCSASQPDATHGGLGAGADHPHLFDARYGIDDLLCQAALSLGRCAIAGAPREGLVDCRDHPRMPMAKNHRPP